MRIVSFNILSDDFVEFQDSKFIKRWYNGIDPERLRLHNRLPKLLQKMESFHSDVFLLQEVMPGARQAIYEHFGDTFYVGPVTRHNMPSVPKAEHSGNMVMVRKSLCHKRPQFYIGTMGVHAPSKDEYTYASALVVWRHSKSAQRSRSLQRSRSSQSSYLPPSFLVSLHFSDVQTERAQQARKFLRDLDQFGPGVDMIIGGDFNTHSQSLHKRFQRRFYSSIKVPTGTYLCENPMIDYIYTSAPIKAARIDNQPLEHPGTCYDRTIRDYGSDHYPVVADI